MAKILVKFKNEVVEEVAVGDAPVTIGRTDENDIKIDNLGVSRSHARVVKEGEEFILEDLGSQNGTVVNGIKIDQKCTLQDKDDITIGKYALIFMKFEDVQEAANKKIRPLRPPGKKFMPAEETLEIGGSGKGSATAEISPCRVEILEGAADQKELKFEKVLIVAGKGANADIKIKGKFDSDTAFIISARPTGFFLSPTKGVEIKLDGQKVTETLKMKDGNVIEVGEAKVKFHTK